MKRDLLDLTDLNVQEIYDILDLTTRLKKDRTYLKDQLYRKNIGLVFQKPSNRTRVSFEVGVYQLGGNCLYLGPEEINLGVRESIADVSKTLSRYLDAIVARTYKHEDIAQLALNSTIPVINGLSDLSHPCQGLTDLFSIYEKFGKLENINVAYIGDGNNVCHSLMLACTMVGANIHIATPQGYEPDAQMIQNATTFAKKSGGHIHVSHNPQEAVKNADVIYSDVWVSMGQEEENEKRLKDFQGFIIDAKLASLANPQHIFMHCLPAHRGIEVTSDVIDGSHSIIFDQAENRLHVQKAIMILLIRTHEEHPQ